MALDWKRYNIMLREKVLDLDSLQQIMLNLQSAAQLIGKKIQQAINIV